ncbi:hypothetical protein [uncultured Tenacibaculum sp.]|uniref:hypothetical protein n=1 Tax=uncultured Tenacibaculum sp. TaxID=174713 RepID=UPI0026316279|nr:hypothetical protein [uncultured Tenacibaculum sp.]
MKKKETKISDYLKFIGIVLLLFGCTYAFTRPYFLKSFNFSETGQIGDTIGGITAPVINIIGAWLVYLSFKEQMEANKFQYKLLKDQEDALKKDRNFQIALELFNSLKEENSFLYKDPENISTLKRLINALKQLDNDGYEDEQIKKTVKNYLSILNKWKYIIIEYEFIKNHIENSNLRNEERLKIDTLVDSFYKTFLKDDTDYIKMFLNKHDIDLNKI